VLSRDKREEGEKKMPKEPTRPGVRITNQFRRRDAMVYDLSCDDIRLTIEVMQRPNDDGLGEWTIEAHTRQAVDKTTIHEPGVTRTDALHAVARAWAARRGAMGFPALDWEAVSAAMLVVRAI
jgi:hypothetical protein